MLYITNIGFYNKKKVRYYTTKITKNIKGIKNINIIL
jgi:hypothetical protein